METKVLRNGKRIPSIGFGTWQLDDPERNTELAIRSGYRHIDCASIYGNEAEVGRGIKNSNVPRETLFITSKCWNTERGYDKALCAFEKTLTDLGLEYLDLYLIHWPAVAKNDPDWERTNRETWRALERLYDEGLVRAIGVSNFCVPHLQRLMGKANTPVMVDQLELHVGFTQQETVTFCQQNQIVLEAWSPFGNGKLFGNERLERLAQRYGVDVGRLCVKWCIQNGFIPLPKASSLARMIDNADVDGFTLSAADMECLNAMPFCGGLAMDPERMDE